MADKCNGLCEKLTNIHFWCTVCGILLFLPCTPVAIACFMPGAGSLYAALGYLVFGGFPAFGICGLWLITFPVFYTVSYMIPAIRRRYIPFLILVFADTAFCCFAALLGWRDAPVFGFVWLLPDVVISIAFSFVYFFAVKAYRKELRTAECTKADSLP